MRSVKLLFLLIVLFATTFCFGAERKVKSRVAPAYPELAKKVHLSGSVKLEVLIAADGGVTSAKILGGHPLLANAAVDAVRKWKFEAGPAESTIVVVEFSPSSN